MKRIIALVLVCLMTIFVISCGNKGCNHEWTEATCETPKICEKCDVTEGEPLGHTTEEGICERCGEKFVSDTWELGEFVDEFGQNTGEIYLSTTVSDGKFSNSATTNSELTAIVQVTSDGIGIMLVEYGWSVVKCSYGYDSYNVVMLDINKNRSKLSGTMYEGGSRIRFSDSDESKIIDALLAGEGEISFYIEDAERTTTNYLFTVHTSNFAELYAEL